MKNLVFVINEKQNYGRHLGTALISVLKNSKEKWNVYIIYEIISEDTIQKINIIVNEYDSKIKYIKLQKNLLNKFKVGNGTHLSTIVFGRLYIPNLLKNENKAIYLDADLVVLKPLEELYNMDLKEYSIGVIPDGKKDQISSLNRLNMDLTLVYFNAGVIVMDLKRLRENKKFIETMEYCLTTERELKLNDQDALNIIFNQNFMTNSIIWNYTHGNSEENNFQLSELGIIHFTGSIKPWDCRNYSPYKNIYWKYLNITPWKGTKEENKTVKNILNREITKFKLKTRKLRYIFKNKKV